MDLGPRAQLCTCLMIPQWGAGLHGLLEVPKSLSLQSSLDIFSPIPQGRPGGAGGGGADGEAEPSSAPAAVQVTPRCAVPARAAEGHVASGRTPVVGGGSCSLEGETFPWTDGWTDRRNELLHPPEAGAESPGSPPSRTTNYHQLFFVPRQSGPPMLCVAHATVL